MRNYPGETPIIDGLRDNAGSGVNYIVMDDGVWSGVPGTRSTGYSTDWL